MVMCIVSPTCVNLHIRFDECSMNSIVIYMYVQSFSRAIIPTIFYTCLIKVQRWEMGEDFFKWTLHTSWQIDIETSPLFRFAKFITGLLALVPCKNSILPNKNETELSGLSVYRGIERRLETKSSVEKFRLCCLNWVGICVPVEMEQKIYWDWAFMAACLVVH